VATWKTPGVDVQGAHHIALTVSNLEASAAFYEDLFDLEVLMNEASDNRKATVYRIAGSDLQFGLVEHDPNRGSFDPRRVGLDHFAFSVASREALDAWAEKLAAHGVTHSQVVDVPPGAILNFKDPDGVALAFFWDRNLQPT
jgi:catechol 2,3-dioxygenase-like lactoylglutathione lyase family enzyme